MFVSVVFDKISIKYDLRNSMSVNVVVCEYEYVVHEDLHLLYAVVGFLFS